MAGTSKLLIESWKEPRPDRIKDPGKIATMTNQGDAFVTREGKPLLPPSVARQWERG